MSERIPTPAEAALLEARLERGFGLGENFWELKDACVAEGWLKEYPTWGVLQAFSWETTHEGIEALARYRAFQNAERFEPYAPAKRTLPNAPATDDFAPYGNVQYPHCDSRVLHAPLECEFCDRHPDWQADRIARGIAFTGHAPLPGQKPCPADADRPPGSPADHRRWGGNKPTSADGDPNWPRETFASQAMYGDRGGRVPWPEDVTSN